MEKDAQNHAQMRDQLTQYFQARGKSVESFLFNFPEYGKRTAYEFGKQLDYTEQQVSRMVFRWQRDRFNMKPYELAIRRYILKYCKKKKLLAQVDKIGEVEIAAVCQYVAAKLADIPQNVVWQRTRHIFLILVRLVQTKGVAAGYRNFVADATLATFSECSVSDYTRFANLGKQILDTL